MTKRRTDARIESGEMLPYRSKLKATLISGCGHHEPHEFAKFFRVT